MVNMDINIDDLIKKTGTKVEKENEDLLISTFDKQTARVQKLVSDVNEIKLSLQLIQDKQSRSLQKSPEFNNIVNLARKQFNINLSDLDKSENDLLSIKTLLSTKIIPSANNSLNRTLDAIKNLRDTSAIEKSTYDKKNYIERLTRSDSEVYIKIADFLDKDEEWLRSMAGNYEYAIEDLILLVALLLDILGVEEIPAFKKYYIAEKQ